jgi:hypothetical protein
VEVGMRQRLPVEMIVGYVELMWIGGQAVVTML